MGGKLQAEQAARHFRRQSRVRFAAKSRRRCAVRRDRRATAARADSRRRAAAARCARVRERLLEPHLRGRREKRTIELASAREAKGGRKRSARRSRPRLAPTPRPANPFAATAATHLYERPEEGLVTSRSARCRLVPWHLSLFTFKANA